MYHRYLCHMFRAIFEMHYELGWDGATGWRRTQTDTGTIKEALPSRAGMALLKDYHKFDLLACHYESDDEELDDHFSQAFSLPPSSSSTCIVIFSARNYWNHCCFNIQKHAASVQDQFACLSTLGGAHFLVSQDRDGQSSEECVYTALCIAKRQEALAIMLGSTTLQIKAKVGWLD